MSDRYGIRWPAHAGRMIIVSSKRNRNQNRWIKLNFYWNWSSPKLKEKIQRKNVYKRATAMMVLGLFMLDCAMSLCTISNLCFFPTHKQIARTHQPFEYSTVPVFECLYDSVENQLHSCETFFFLLCFQASSNTWSGISQSRKEIERPLSQNEKKCFYTRMSKCDIEFDEMFI